MRVALAYVRHAGDGGVEHWLNTIATALAERGHQVDILCRAHETAPHAGVRFVRLRPFALGSAWRAWAFARTVAQTITREDYDLSLALGRTVGHDVVRLGMGCHQTFLERCVPVAAGRPTLKDRVTLALEERSLHCRRIIANSQLVARDVSARYGIAAERITVIGNGADLERFHPRHRNSDETRRFRAECELDGDAPVALFLGSGFQRKGLDRALLALQAAPRLRLLVVGHDSRAQEYVRQASALGVSERVRFLGARRDATTCYAAADLLLLPTRYDPFANSTVEALASGLPVITTQHNGGSEVLDAGVHGAVVGDDPDELRTAVRDWSDRDRLAAAATACRARAEQHPQAAKLAQLIDVLLAAAASGRNFSEKPSEKKSTGKTR